MFCKSCGVQASEGTKFCQNCGAQLGNGETAQYGVGYCQYNAQSIKEKANTGLVILSIIFPIIGIILFFTQKESEPNAHKTYLKAALISIGVSFGLSILLAGCSLGATLFVKDMVLPSSTDKVSSIFAYTA